MLTTEERNLLNRLLHLNRNSIHPGKGKRNARLIREVCETFGFDEDVYLPSYVVRNKKDWGLK